MQTKFKRHQKVKLLADADPEYVEYYEKEAPVKRGMLGRINILLPNGKYHVEILDKKGGVLAYAPFAEEELEEVEE
jgi:hypothetical protein